MEPFALVGGMPAGECRMFSGVRVLVIHPGGRRPPDLMAPSGGFGHAFDGFVSVVVHSATDARNL